MGFMGTRGSINMVKLAERRVFSHSFKPIYEEGMGLVEEAAEFLDGEGRILVRGLSRIAASLYAAESMRLTTRLMQLASWLLLQRAANSGEMSREQVAAEKSKVCLDTAEPQEGAPGWSELPEEFCDLIRRSLRLEERVRRMDQEIYGDGVNLEDEFSLNPVSDQIMLLETAFARG